MSRRVGELKKTIPDSECQHLEAIRRAEQRAAADSLNAGLTHWEFHGKATSPDLALALWAEQAGGPDHLLEKLVNELNR